MASYYEIDSFVTKFKQLMSNGFKASLTLESEDGDVSVVMKAGLGCVKPLSLRPPQTYAESVKKFNRSPSYFRRQERRHQARESSLVNSNGIKDVVDIVTTASNESVAVEASSLELSAGKAAEKVSGNVLAAEKATESSVKADHSLSCQTCGISFKEKTSVKVHEDKYHGIPHSANNNGDIFTDSERDTTLHYWKTGHMIDVYQTYLDVIDDITNSNLSKEDKCREEEKALEGRKKSLGSNYMKFPPWRK